MALELALAALFGGAGGLLRAIVGVFKAIKEKKKLDVKHFLLTALFGVLIGMVTGMLLNFFDWRLPFISGYAGTDVLEGIVKIFKSGKAYGLITKK
ncbi:hypothetical protein HN592_04035 [Candidatus Woesearchaeota archaeon]|jgi:hypothetical protein|nr:hypothetical protein [Candidatus Woesearchaeota archaeon]MBT4368381.1 hypothetical protein [Candidatus Woesearchaeota archaeon]MBT4712870.1 hypothetical protein [Candidatus Woesearchaeota archaeon]MBT6639782.1 hypothetical protein [Candidatus Woesearchaeota archaeon]MBT7133954.1 hypothetical protein [Candidatus Woesearchaeota archaeon]